MARYIDEKDVYALVEPTGTARLHCSQIDALPRADVVPKSEVAELLRLMFADDCACNYNGNDEWLPFKCKYALTDCPMPKERLGCWMEFVEYGLAELKKKYTGESK